MRPAILILLLLVGCARTTVPTRELNHQNWDAARQMTVNINDLDVPEEERNELLSYTIDIGMNSEAMAADFEWPENRTPYSPGASAEMREEQQVAIESRNFWSGLWDFVKTVAATATGVPVKQGNCAELMVGIAAALGLGGLLVTGEVNRRRSRA